MKTTKRALLTSVMALILCFSMLVGTTFAWFTDEVKSANNIITAGNLDVNLYWSTDAENWTEVNEKTNVFDKVDLWEPGKTQVVYLKIVNEGTLALKYQLGVNVASETAGTRFNKETGDDEAFKLSDFIKYRVMDYTKTYAADERDVAIADAEKDAGATKLNEAYNSGTIKLEAKNDADTDEKIVTVVVYMPTTVGNEANYKTGTTPPTINLGINLFATQVEGEFDSFDDKYDEDAIYFDALVKTDAELLAAIQDPKVEVIAIDENVTYNWGNQSYENSQALLMAGKTFYGVDGDEVITFEGYGSANPIVDVTLKNLTVADKTVGDNENAWEHGHLEFAGLYAENVVFMDSVMLVERPASATYSLRSTTVQKVTDSTLINCTFNNTIKSWYALWVDGGDATIRDCSFTGTRAIKAHEAYGSEIGTVVIANNEFVDLSEKPGVVIGDVNADTSITLTNNTFAGTQAGDQDLYSYETDTDVTTFTFIYDKSNTVAGYAKTNTELSEQLQNNATVVMPAGEFSLPSMSGKEGITIIGAADGSTVVGGENSSTGFGSYFGKDTTIKNVTFSGTSNGVRWSYANGGTSTFENCTFAGDSTYGFHIDESHGATFIFNNCTFSGFNAFAGDLVKVVFNNCTFLNNGNYGHTNIWSVAELNNCTFTDETSISGGKLYFNGVEESYHHEYIGSAESLFAFADSVNNGADAWSGQKIVLVDDIDLNNAAWTPIGQTGATQFQGTFDGNGFTIKNLNVDSSAQTGEHYSSGLFGWAESHVTIKNVKVDGAKVVGNHNVAVIVGYTYSGKVINCHVTNAEIVCTHANDDACGDKCGLIAGYAGNESRITDCSGADSTVKAGRDAGQLIGAGYNVSLSGCSAENVSVTAGGNCTGANINEAIIGRVLG